MCRGVPVLAISLTLIAPALPAAQESGGVQDRAVERFGRILLQAKTAASSSVRIETANALLGLSQGANRPSPETLRAFVDTLLAAISGSRLSEEGAMRLAFDIHEVLHCAFLNDERFEAVLNDAHRRLRDAGVARSAAGGLVGRLRAMGDEVRETGRAIDVPF